MGVFSAGRPVGRITLEIDIPEVVTTFEAHERALVNQRHRRGSITSFGRAHWTRYGNTLLWTAQYGHKEIAAFTDLSAVALPPPR